MVVGIAGSSATLLIELLRAIQHVAWTYHSGPFLERSSAPPRAAACFSCLVGGVVAGSVRGAARRARQRGHLGGDLAAAAAGWR